MRPHPDFGVYLHIPFCEKKCVYCDFYSLENMEHKDVFVSLLIEEIIAGAKKYSDHLRPATSVFFGGGTPSLLTPEQISTIMETLRDQLTIHPDAEITMECNPGTISIESLRGYKQAGINRLSFGIQSFNQEELNFLHRIHTPEEGKVAVRIAREAGFDNVNIDIIFALPNQTIASWTSTLEQAMALNTEHISAYSLIFEEKTPLFSMLQKGLVKPQDEERDAELYALTIDALSKAGYIQYEVSNFAKPGFACNHNRTYWQAKEYLAFGPSAHGFISKQRYWNYRNLKRYFEAVRLHGTGEASIEVLTDHNMLYETAFLGIRSEGLSKRRFLTDFGIDLHAMIFDRLDAQILNEFLQVYDTDGDTIISLNSSGFAICDEISVRIIALLEEALGSEWDAKGYEEEDDSIIDLPILQDKTR
ncbi:MAG: radical SAM family heme chaperone HemW [Ignavibacteria bacterium]|nr:radical SAM family heme chaperone HemW [Ignavibacteria bacterium]